MCLGKCNADRSAYLTRLARRAISFRDGGLGGRGALPIPENKVQPPFEQTTAFRAGNYYFPREKNKTITCNTCVQGGGGGEDNFRG